MGGRAVGDEDEGAAGDGDGDDGAVNWPETLEDRFDRGDGLAKQEGVAEEGETWRAGREAPASNDGGEEEGDGSGEEEGEEEERPWVLHGNREAR